MAEQPAFVTRLKSALEQELPALLDAPAEVEVEPAGATKLFRFYVFSDAFKDLRHSERQNLVWRIADAALAPNEAVKISMILTLTKNEFEETGS